MLTIRPKDRIAIYFFYDPYGVADRYVLRFLEGLREIADRVFVVVNGPLEKASEEKIRQITNEILIRENTGYDAWAYKAAFEAIGWDVLRAYEEVVYCNATIFGPVYPFSEMFGKMAEKEDLDFWGISFHPDLMTKDTLNPWGYIPEHIQHYFVVYRKRFTNSPELKEYWDKLPPITNYAETVGLHETVFTKYFADRGYRWDTYIRYTEEEESTHYMLMYEPLKALVKYRSPVIKRKVFFLENSFVLSNSIGERVTDLLEQLQKDGLYDTDLIYENIIRTCDQREFIDNFNFRYVLPEDYEIPGGTEETASRAALVMLLTRPDSEAEAAETAACAGDALTVIRLPLYEYEGDGFAACLPRLRELADRFAYLCLWNDRDYPEVKFNTSQRSNSETQRRALLASPAFARNVVTTFERNRHLGMLRPMPPMTGKMHEHLSQTWDGVYEEGTKWARELGLRVPISRDTWLISGRGYFWYRAEALKRILSCDWETLMREQRKVRYMALEFLCPYLVQDSGFAPGYVTSDRLAGHQFSILLQYVKKTRKYETEI